MQQPVENLQNEFLELLEGWQDSPYKYALEALNVKPTTQQKQFLDTLGELVRCKMKRWKTPEALTPEELEIAKKIGISVMSAKGCHAKGTKILRYNGTIANVEDLRPGDFLIGEKSEPQMISHLVHGIEKFYRIQYAWGDYYDVNESHILSLIATGNHHKITQRGDIVDITVKDYLNWPRWKKNLFSAYKRPVKHWKSQRRKMPIPPYILGVWLGDGCKSGAQFACTDPEILKEIADCGIDQDMFLRTYNYKDHTLSTGKGKGTAPLNPMLQALKKLGIFRNKHIPQQYLIANEKDRLELLAGLIDTDGWIDRRKSGAQYGFIQKSEELTDQVVFLARSLGFHVTKAPVIKKWTYKGITKRDIYYRLNISRGNISRIPVRVERKKAPKTNCKDLNFQFTVQELPEQEFYGFSLTGSGRFLGADFTVLHNTGKDCVLSWAILWFLTMFKGCKIPITGPSRDQMRVVLMAEISKWCNQTDTNGDPQFVFYEDTVIQTDKVFMKNPDKPENEGKEWFAFIRTPPKSNTEEMQSKKMDGLHEDFMMIAVDEADGVNQSVLTSLETTLTSPVNFMLLIFNPTKNYGYAYDTHYGPQAEYYLGLQWSALDSENVDTEQVERIRKVHGEDSPEYRVNVLGLPPEQSDEILIPLEWIDQSIGRDITPDKKTLRIMGVDPSRQGGDPAGVVIRKGHVIEDMVEFRKLDTIELADEIAAIFVEWNCDLMYIDTIGNGAGVYDQLKRRFPGKVRSVDVSTKPRDDRKKFHRLRDELWWKVRSTFEQNLISIPQKHKLTRKLKSELQIMKRDKRDDDGGKIKIESKAQMKARGLKSPNLADAYMVTMAAQDTLFGTIPQEDKRKKKDPYEDIHEIERRISSENSWMLV